MTYAVSQRNNRSTIANKKNYLLNPQVKVILPQVKMLQERFFFPNMKFS